MVHILWRAAAWYLFLWSTASEWHCTFYERQSHHIFFYDQQQVSDIAHFAKPVSSHLCYDQQFVSDIAHFVKGGLITAFLMTTREYVTLHILWKGVSSQLFLWPTGSEWHCTFCQRQFHHIFSYDQQEVSDIVHFVKGSLITSFPMTNSLWVTLHICERQSHHIIPYDQQQVSDIAHFVKDSLITSFSMTNSKWVTLHILCNTVPSHFFLWQTASK